MFLKIINKFYRRKIDFSAILFGYYRRILYFCITNIRQRQSVADDKHQAKCKGKN